jgi:hypothetical protein
MPELNAIVEASRNRQNTDRKFLAALQGVDLDKQSVDGNDAWEKIKAKAFSGGKTSDPNDIVSLQGHAAKKAGFGIGEGLEYEVID